MAIWTIACRHAKLLQQNVRCRDATAIMGGPVLASAITTIAAALPLSFTQTIALSQFGTIIAFSLSASLVYAMCMLIPLLAICGPAAGPSSYQHGNCIMRIWFGLWHSTLSRAGLVSVASLCIMVRICCYQRFS